MALISNQAHEHGLTTLSFSPDGKFAYTGGSDTLVRIWRTDKGADQEPEIATDAGEGITALSASKTNWLSASEDGDVRLYNAGQSDLQGIVTNAAGVGVRSVAVDPKGKRVAVTSDELSVKLVDIEDNSKIILLAGHTRGVRRATWHPSGTLLTTSGSDGKLIIWDVSSSTPTQEKIIDNIIPAVPDTESPEFTHDASALWHPGGQYLFLATHTHDIVTVYRPDYTTKDTFSDPSHPSTGPITALAVSPNGLYLASAQKGDIKIWSIEKKRVLWTHTPPSTEATITHLAFSPTQNLLAWTDAEGVFSRWPSPIPPNAPDPVKTPLVTTALQNKPRRRTPDLFADAGSSVKGGERDEFDDDWIIDDLGGNAMEDDPPERDRSKKSGGYVKEMVSITKAQPAFQPGSTPMGNKKRYLAFNMIGAIEVTDQDTHHIVNVVFHDQSSRKGYHFTDHFKYDLASLGERGIAFACQPENDHPAQVLFKPYTSWSSSSSQYDWTYTLGKNTRVLGLAVTGPKSISTPASAWNKKPKTVKEEDDMGMVVVATSDGDMTFMSGNKREKMVMDLDGEFVAMVAGDEWVFYVHRPGATTIDGSQSLVGTMVSYDRYHILQSRPLPVPKGHTLKWVGISDQGAPIVYESSGKMHIMVGYRIPNCGNWVRLLDTNQLDRRQGDAFRQESYWPIGVTHDSMSCIIVKGTAEYPGFPRPFPSELPLRVPFRGERGDDPKKPTDAVLEEQIARETLYLDYSREALGDELTTTDISKREMEQDKKLLKLIQYACKEDKAPRVLEFVCELNHLQSLDAAITIANFYKLPGLKEKISFLKADRERVDWREKSRDERREWAGHAEPIPPPRHPLEDFRPAPTISRPGLQPAVPVVEHSKYSAANIEARTAAGGSLTPPDSKRKRDDDLDSMGPPKPKANPFARKPEGNRNPFARKPDTNKTIQKSESFFDKVDAAESDTGKRPLVGKGKDKKEPTRQSTLFGLPMGKPAERKTKKKKIANDSSQATSVEPEGDPDTQTSSTQASDIMMAEAPSEATLVETQPTDDDEQVETQPESQDVPESMPVDDTNGNEETEDPIEWPASPQPSAEVDVAA